MTGKGKRNERKIQIENEKQVKKPKVFFFLLTKSSWKINRFFVEIT